MAFQISLLEVPKTAKTVISLDDEAVDQAKLTPELKKRYVQTLDVSILPMIEGRKPIEYRVLPLSDSAHDQCLIEAFGRGEVEGRFVSTSANHALFLAYFAAGVQRVANVPQVTAEGTVVADLDPEHWGKLPFGVRVEIGTYVGVLTMGPTKSEPKNDVGK